MSTVENEGVIESSFYGYVELLFFVVFLEMEHGKDNTCWIFLVLVIPRKAGYCNHLRVSVCLFVCLFVCWQDFS